MGAPLFRDARLKLDWANKHIRHLEAAISAVEEEAIATFQRDGVGLSPGVRQTVKTLSAVRCNCIVQ
jgi:hypothetical protein